MKKLTARSFKIILITLMVLVVALIVGGFSFGYNMIKTTATNIGQRQADAKESENAIANMQQLEKKLAQLNDIPVLLNRLQSSSSLPQFETENNLRTITNKLGINIKNVVFLNDETASSSSSSSKTGSGTTSAKPATPPAINSRISFELDQPISWQQLINLLEAIETNMPKLKLESIALPSDSNDSAINPGVLILTMATKG